MPSPQFTHVIETIEQIETSLDHMNIKWLLFCKQGYLPSTNVFENIKHKISELKKDIHSNRDGYIKIFDNKKICEKEISTEKNEGGTSKIVFKKIENDYAEKLINDLNPAQIELLSKTDIPNDIIKLHNLKSNLYNRVEAISDMLNALNYCFISRVSGVFSPEATFAKDMTTKKFGGIQLIYNSTETLMKDYVESYSNNEKYNGLVVFGFRNRAVAYPTSLVVFPAYSEHDLEYLTILAHESFHLIHGKIESKMNKLKYKNKRAYFYLDNNEKTLIDIKSKMTPILKRLSQIYIPEDFPDKNIHPRIVTESIAVELMADIYATIVAGEAYPLMLYNYYLPIIVNVESGHVPRFDYSAFCAGSLKLRVSLMTLEEIFRSNGSDINSLKFYYKGKNINLVRYLNEQINKWENISINLIKLHPHPQKIDLYTIDVEGKKSVKQEIIKICNNIHEQKIISDMNELIDKSYYQNDLTLEVFKQGITNVYNIFKQSKSPSHEEIFKIWNDYSWLEPKHLISILAIFPPVNRNALLMSLAYHKNISERFILRN